MGANDPRSGASPFPGMPYPGPPMPYADPRGLWLGPAVLGMLLVQFLLLALLAWKTLVPESGEPVAAPVAGGRTVAVATGSDAAGDASRVAREAEIQLQLLDRIVDQLGQGTPRGLVPLLEQLQQENEVLKADARVYRTLEAKVKAENEALSRALAAAEENRSELSEEVAQLKHAIRQKDLAEEDYRRQIASLNERLASAVPPDAAVLVGDWLRQPKVLVLAAIGLVVVGVLVWAALAARKRPRGFPAGEEPGQDLNAVAASEEPSQARPTAIR